MDKPAGLLCQPGRDRGEEDLCRLLRRDLAARVGHPEPYLALAHRLDRGTSGLVVLSKTRHANPGLARQFRDGQVRKGYLALTALPAPPLPLGEQEIRSRLLARRSRGRLRQQVVSDGGQEAWTTYRIVACYRRGLRVEARPHTGRLHQIRAHLASVDLPILGDRLYGTSPAVCRAAPRPLLHAAAIALVHPVTGEPIELRAPLPPDFEAAERALHLDDGPP